MKFIDNSCYMYKDTLKTGRAVVIEEQELLRRPDVKRAVLQYRLLQYAEEMDLSLMEIQIDTGRFHQICAQVSHAGMALRLSGISVFCRNGFALAGDSL